MRCREHIGIASAKALPQPKPEPTKRMPKAMPSRGTLLQTSGQAVGPCADRACTKANDHITGARLLAHQPLQIVFVHDGARVAMAMSDQTCHKIVAAGPIYRVFSSGKNKGRPLDLISTPV